MEKEETLESEIEANKLSRRISVSLSNVMKKIKDDNKDKDRSLTQSLIIDKSKIEEEITPDDSDKESRVFSIASLNFRFKVSFIHKGNSLIYIAISKDANESVTFLKR